MIVELYDRRSYQATLIGSDKISDLALLKIDAPDLIPADWGDSDALDVGAIVWAIGSPYGFQQTVTSGILSGKDRPGDRGNPKQALLQTDAAVNPGNSGGPLVDSQGRVIGINTSIFGETFQGISFAVPSATVNFVYDQLRSRGKVIRGYLGVYPDQVSFYDSQRLNMPDLFGARLSRVEPDSPAFIAGIRPDDVIRAWNDIEIKEFKSLFRLAETTPPNETVDVTLLRNGELHHTKVKLGELPDYR
jgi:serine protease Do